MKIPKNWLIVSLLVLMLFCIPFFSYFKFPIKGIEIRSDSDFKRYMCPGNGTKENPYRIENRKISFHKDKENRHAGILITHTTKYVTIKDCNIQGAYVAIELDYLRSGRVEILNCTIQNSETALEIFQVDEGVTIQGNQISSNEDIGSIMKTSNTVISNNYMEDNYSGLRIVSRDDQKMYNFIISLYIFLPLCFLALL